MAPSFANPRQKIEIRGSMRAANWRALSTFSWTAAMTRVPQILERLEKDRNRRNYATADLLRFVY